MTVLADRRESTGPALLGRRAPLIARPADREEAPVHEPGDEDRPRDEADEVAGGAEEDGLEEAPG